MIDDMSDCLVEIGMS